MSSQRVSVFTEWQPRRERQAQSCRTVGYSAERAETLNKASACLVYQRVSQRLVQGTQRIWDNAAERVTESRCVIWRGWGEQVFVFFVSMRPSKKREIKDWLRSKLLLFVNGERCIVLVFTPSRCSQSGTIGFDYTLHKTLPSFIYFPFRTNLRFAFCILFASTLIPASLHQFVQTNE